MHLTHLHNLHPVSLVENGLGWQAGRLLAVRVVASQQQSWQVSVGCVGLCVCVSWFEGSWCVPACVCVCVSVEGGSHPTERAVSSQLLHLH